MQIKTPEGDYVFILEKASSNLSVEKRGDDYILEGIAAVFGKENSNNRIYEESEYLPHLEYLNEKIASKRLVGELDHPKDFDVSLKNVSHLIETLSYDKGSRSLKIRVRLLNTPAGKIAQNLVEAGIPISISSRAAGQVNENKRVAIKKIFTYDLVCDPGFPNAQLERVYESLSSFPSFNETIKKPSIIDNLILMNEGLGLSENSDSKIYNVTGNNQFLKLLETEEKNKSSYEMKNYVTAEELDEYSIVLKKEFDTIKESIDKIKGVNESNSIDTNLEERVKKLETYSSYLAENLENAIKYGDYLSKNLDDAISYSRYLAENLDKSISYGKYLAEHLDRSISYSEYIAESVDANVSKTESISEKLDQTVAYSEYIAENVDKTIGYTEYLAENVDKNISYAEYLAENVDKSIGYSEYLAEKLDKNISYGEYLAENLSKGISYSEYLAEKIKNNISYSEYIAESFNKISANMINENIGSTYEIDENKDSGFVQNYTGLSGKIDALLESVQKQKTEQPKKTNIQQVDATLNEGQETSGDSTELPKTGIKFIDEIPEKFKPIWESLNEGQKSSLMAQSKFYKLESEYQINNFWSTRNLGTPALGLQKLDESENNKIEKPKQAYSNSYVESIAKALEGKFPNKK
jgi:hypothetical protein